MVHARETDQRLSRSVGGSPAEISIRPFRLADYRQVVDLWRSCGLRLRGVDERAAIRLRLRRDRGLFLVALDASMVVGSVLGSWDGRRAWVHRLAVVSAFRRRGIASALVRELERRVRAKGAREIWAVIDRDNLASRRVHERLGFGCHEWAVVYGRELAGEPPAISDD